MTLRKFWRAALLTSAVSIAAPHAVAQKVIVPFVDGKALTAAQLNTMQQGFVAASGGDASNAMALAKASSIARSLSDRFAEHCNVLDYGAKNDQITDDTASWQAAINACAAKGGGIVDVPGGVSIIGTLNVPSFIAIHGRGMRTSVIQSPTLTGDTFNFLAGAHYVEISGIEYNGFSNHRTGGSFFHICGTCGTIWIHNVSSYFAYNVMRVDSDGTEFGGATEIYADTLDFRNTQTGSNAFEVDGGNDLFVSHLTMDNDWSSVQPAAGFAINKTGGFWLSDSDIINFTNNMKVTGSNNTAWGFVINTAFDTSHADNILFDAPNGTVIYGWQFVASWISSASNGDGIHFQSEGGTIDGFLFATGKIMNNSKDGIDIESGLHFDIADSMIVGDGAANYSANQGYVGVRITGGNSVQSIRVHHNTIGTAMQYPIYPAVAVKVEDQVSTTNYSDYLSITDNDLRGTLNKQGLYYNAGNRQHVIAEHNWGDDGDD